MIEDSENFASLRGEVGGGYVEEFESGFGH